MKIKKTKRLEQKARDENTSSETLAQLATSKKHRTRKYVACNVNTPVETLLKLAREFPEEVMANPVFDLLILSNPRKVMELKRNIALAKEFTVLHINLDYKRN